MVDSEGRIFSSRPLYVRLEPTDDPEVPDKKDVVGYTDEACTEFYCRWPWHRAPKRGETKAVINSCQWRLTWLKTKWKN